VNNKKSITSSVMLMTMVLAGVGGGGRKIDEPLGSASFIFICLPK